MSLFKRKIPVLFKEVMEMLTDDDIEWTCNIYIVRSGSLSIWVNNRPYADMSVNDTKPPRWVARKMRPLVDKVRANYCRSYLRKKPEDF